jgi:4-amino-4-deoxy-L-arabinose transferase-like glycosyltransferase
MARRLWLPLIILGLAFGLRAWRLDLVYFNHDAAVPHGLGIGIVEAVQDGRWADLPTLSFPTGVGLRNPIGISYVWAAVALFDRTPYTAAVLSVLLNVLGVAALYSFARKIGNRRLGAIAAFLMAISPWSIAYARIPWLQGQLEAFATITAWLVFAGALARNPRRLFAGLALAALLMQTYLTAFGLGVQAALASLSTVGRGPSRAIRRATLAGIGLCALGILLYAALIVTSPDSGLSGVGRASERSLESPVSFPNPFGLHLDRAPIERALGLVSGREFGADLPDEPAVIRMARMLMGGALEILVLAGISTCVIRFKYDPAKRTTLLWFAVPIIGAMVVSARFPLAGIGGRQYMFLTAPAGYLLAAFGAAVVLDLASRIVAARVLSAALAVLSLVWVTTSGLGVLASYQAQSWMIFDPLQLGDFALRYQPDFAAAWHAACARSANPQLPEWQASLLGTMRPIQQARAQFSGQTIAWQIGPNGEDCVTTSSADLAPPYSDEVDRRLVQGVSLFTYRSRPITDENRLLAESGVDRLPTALPSNIGWTLIGDRVVSTADRGPVFRLAQVWRIDSVAQAAREKAYYTLFVKLIDASGRVIDLARSVEDGPLPPGKWWAVGEYVLSWQALVIPMDAAPGPARLEVSLYDAGQKQNAAYFDPAQAGKVIVAREIALQVR